MGYQMNCVNEFPSSVGTRPSKIMEKACIACLQFLIGIVNFLAMLREAKYKSLNAASSFGHEALVLIILRRLMFKDSIAFVV